MANQAERGDYVISILGEVNDCGMLGELRTDPCALGIIDDADSRDGSYAVNFTHSGVRVHLTEEELSDPNQYLVVADPDLLQKIIIHYDGIKEYDTLLVARVHARALVLMLLNVPTVSCATAYDLA